MSTYPLNWWKLHEHSFPLLAKVAKIYLGIPATSVPSERGFFSCAGDIVTAQRSMLNSENVDHLFFWKTNLHVYDDF